MANCRRAAGIVVMLLGMVGTARADEAPGVARERPVPEARPWVVNAQGSFFVNGMPSYASVGVGVERAVTRYLRLDADIGRGLSSTVATTGGDVHVESALDVGGRVRATLPLGARESHSLFLGVGPHYSTGGAYDNLWQGRAEVGYAFRAAGGFSFLYAIGAEVVLADRPAPVAPASCVTSSCPGALRAGSDTTTVVRAALGYAF